MRVSTEAYVTLPFQRPTCGCILEWIILYTRIFCSSEVHSNGLPCHLASETRCNPIQSTYGPLCITNSTFLPVSVDSWEERDPVKQTLYAGYLNMELGMGCKGKRVLVTHPVAVIAPVTT